MVSGLQVVRDRWDDLPVPNDVQHFLREASSRIEDDTEELPAAFVPADYALVYQALQALSPIQALSPTNAGRFLEWGCGMGVVTGLAAMLGWEAEGVERDLALTQKAETLLSDFGLRAEVSCADLRHWPIEADLIYMYMWPEETPAMLEHFARKAPRTCQLLVYNGGDTLRLVAHAH